MRGGERDGAAERDEGSVAADEEPIVRVAEGREPTAHLAARGNHGHRVSGHDSIGLAAEDPRNLAVRVPQQGKGAADGGRGLRLRLAAREEGPGKAIAGQGNSTSDEPLHEEPDAEEGPGIEPVRNGAAGGVEPAGRKPARGHAEGRYID